MLISGNTFIITGGASGLGRAVVDILVLNNANVSIFDMNEELGNSVVAQLGKKVCFCKVNVCDEESVRAGVAKTVSQFGRVDGLLNAAGISSPARVLGKDGKASPLAGFQKIVDINLVGTYNVLRIVAEQIATQKVNREVQGVFVNVSSVAANDGQIGQAGYSASKAGVSGMTLPLSRDLAKYGIRVVCVEPGVFLTPMAQTLPEKAIQSLSNQVTFPKRLGKPEEFGAFIVTLFLQDYLNGENIRLDGGIRMGAM